VGKAKSAEHLVSKQCADFDAIVAAPDDDKFGWDLFVQFPAPPHLGLAENRPPRQHAYTQVKSTIAKNTSAGVKFSNVQEAVSSRSPWFFLMVMPDDTVRGIHLWGTLLENWMKQLRQAGIDGVKLNAKKLSLAFNKKLTIKGNVAEWMLNEVNQIGGNYEEEKRKLTESLGYDNGYGKGNLVFPNMDKKKMALMFLGLHQNVPVSHFTLTKSRFNILDKEPEIDQQPGEITITPRTVGQCKLRLKGVTGEPPLGLIASVFAFKPPHAQPLDSFFRISAPPLEIIRHPEGPFDISLLFEPYRRYPLSTWLNYRKITRWGKAGPIDVQMTTSTGRIGAQVNLDPIDDRQVEIMCAAIDGIDEIVLATGGNPPELSEADLAESFRELRNFATAMQTDLDMLFEDLDTLPSYKKVMYRTGIKFEHVYVSCFVEREILFDTVLANGRLLKAGAPKIVEANTITVTGSFDTDFLQDEYDHYREGVVDLGTVLDLGDINTLMNSKP
jgi:hypothetical protein